MRTCVIGCDGQDHRIGMTDDGELVLLDHDLDEEETLHVMDLGASFCFECLHDFRDNPTYMLWQASSCKDTGVFAMAIAAGANVRLNDDDILKRMSMNGRTEYVRQLLDAGANVHAGGEESLIIAGREGHTEVVRLLLGAGADVSVQNYTVLREAAAMGYGDIVRAVLQCGVEHRAKNEGLLAAYANGRKELFDVFTEAGADPGITVTGKWDSA